MVVLVQKILGIGGQQEPSVPLTEVCLCFPSCQASSVLVTQSRGSERAFTEYALQEDFVHDEEFSFDLGL